MKLGHSVITVAGELPEANRHQHWLGRTIPPPPVNTSPLSAEICPDILIPARHEKMSYSSPSRRRQLVLYTFYPHFSLFTGRANIGHSGSCGDVGEQASSGQEKEKEEERFKHKEVARFGCILASKKVGLMGNQLFTTYGNLWQLMVTYGVYSNDLISIHFT